MWQIRSKGCRSPKNVVSQTLNHQEYDGLVSGRHRSGGSTCILSSVVSMRGASCLNRDLRITQMYNVLASTRMRFGKFTITVELWPFSVRSQQNIICVGVYMYMHMYICACIWMYAHIYVINVELRIWYICCIYDTKCTTIVRPFREKALFYCHGMEIHWLYCRDDATKVYKRNGNLRLFLPGYV